MLETTLGCFKIKLKIVQCIFPFVMIIWTDFEQQAGEKGTSKQT